ncbi:HAMP domain-containing protein [Chloroflexota bacterium]
MRSPKPSQDVHNIRTPSWTVSRLFGGVVFSESLENVEEASNAFKEVIEETLRVFQKALIKTTAIGIVVLITAVVLVSRNITVPIVQLTDEARSMEKGEYDAQALDRLVERRFEDEVTDLSRVFKQMAKAIHLRETRLKDEIRQLRIEIDEQKKQEEVRRVVESESFQQLQVKAASLRARRIARQKARQKKKDSS